MTKLPKRFWDKVFINEWEPQACWTWEAGKNKKGYGQFWQYGIMQKTHVLSFLDFGGVLTKEKPLVLHKCHEYGFPDNKSCVNPNHLRAGSRSENVRDSIKAGTFRCVLAEKNLLKLNCPQGHELSGTNLDKSQLKFGWRRCKICLNERNKKWRKDAKI